MFRVSLPLFKCKRLPWYETTPNRKKSFSSFLQKRRPCTDLANAHLRALARLATASVTYNWGSGAGHSVIDVIRSVERVSGRTMPVRIVGRRAGDPAALVAASDRLRSETGWAPRFGDLDEIVRTTLVWREGHPLG